MRTRRGVRRALMAGTTVLLLAACGTSTPEPSGATSEGHLACAAGQSAEEMFASDARAGWFTLRAPKLVGWTQQQLEGSAPGFVLHRFDLPTGAAEMGSATVTVTAFSPAATADIALANLRTLRASGPDWQETSSESLDICGQRGLQVSGTDPGADLHHDFLEFPYSSAGSIYPIQVRSQLKAADVARYAADLRTIFDGVRIAP